MVVTQREKVERAALKLTKRDRKAVAKVLLKSIDEPFHGDSELTEAERIAGKESDRRIADYEKGLEEAIPLEQAPSRDSRKDSRMNHSILRSTKREMQRIVDYYDNERPGLGDDFFMEVQSAMKRVCDSPRSHLYITKVSRRCNLHRYPYFIVYQIRKGEILFTGISHQKHSFGAWKKRR